MVKNPSERKFLLFLLLIILQIPIILFPQNSNQDTLKKKSDSLNNLIRQFTSVDDETITNSPEPKASKMVLDIKNRTIVVHPYVIKDKNGTFYEIEGYTEVPLSETDLTALGSLTSERKGKEFILKNDSSHTHIFIFSKALLEVYEPSLISETKGIITKSIQPLNCEVFQPFQYWNDNSSLLIVTINGIFTIINGMKNDLDLRNNFAVDDMKNPKFVKDKKKGVITFSVSNSKKLIDFYVDNEGQITGRANIYEK